MQPFDGIYTDTFAFFDSLTAEQQATLTSGDVTMCAPGDYASGSGLTGADLTDEQRDLLLELITNWAGMADEDHRGRPRRDRATPGDCRQAGPGAFAWVAARTAGPALTMTPRTTSRYR